MAESIDADVLVFDLEDAVPPDNKEQARRMTADAVADGDYRGKELIVRINGLDTKWAAGDIAAATPASPDGILVPKVSRPEDIRRVRAALRAAGAEPSTVIWAMMET
ncbi:MAG: aldolase/citrate lyase family protein, partial [Alphaproteobacteria bacterium]